MHGINILEIEYATFCSHMHWVYAQHHLNYMSFVYNFKRNIYINLYIYLYEAGKVIATKPKLASNQENNYQPAPNRRRTGRFKPNPLPSILAWDDLDMSNVGQQWHWHKKSFLIQVDDVLRKKGRPKMIRMKVVKKNP